MNTLDLSIIIVNWNSKNYLKACIDSVKKNINRIRFEIIVIDSASYDGACEMLIEFHPDVKYIQCENNIGFPKANNEASKFASGTNLLFLNPDTLIHDHSIEVLFDQLNSLPHAGIVGAKLLNSDYSIQTSCVQSFPNIFNLVLDSNFLHKAFPKSKLWGNAIIFSSNNASSIVDVISGACLMIKKSIFDKIGKFSKEFYMYSEDVDLCFKVQAANFNNYFIPTAQIVHYGGGSSAQSNYNAFSAVMILESQWRYFKKNRSLVYARIFRLTFFCACLFRIFFLLFSILLTPFLGGGETKKQNISSIRKWIAKLNWTLGRAKWVRKYR